MNLIIPMAGMGKRMRPHTFQIPKPLLKIAGKTIVERIVEDLKVSSGKNIEEVHYVIGNFGTDVEKNLIAIANGINAKGFIHYQDQALGTAHAVYCAKEGMDSEILIAFADTLFVGDFEISHDDEAIIWTMEVERPENYGVVTTDTNGSINGFVEKPQRFVSNRAIIGIYYFRDGIKLKNDIEKLIDQNFMTSGEFQLTDNLKNLMNEGLKFKCKVIDEWLDCGNKSDFLKSHQRILELGKFERDTSFKGKGKVSGNVYIGKNVEILNCRIGPFVSIGDNCKLENCEIKNSIIANDNKMDKCKIRNSMIGNSNILRGCIGKVNFGDFVEYESI